MSDWLGPMHERRAAEANEADFSFLRANIVTAIRRLASDAERQIAWCWENQLHPVELGEEFFDEVDSSLDYFRIKGLMSPEAEVALAALSAELHETMRRPEWVYLWRYDAMRSAPKWERIRALGRVAMDAMLDLALPDVREHQ